MAEGIKSDYEEQFTCSVCLDILKDPVTIPCGHSYCMSCINKCWVAVSQNGVHSCPQCRETFSPKPALKRNTVLAEVMEKLKITSGQAGAVRIDCDFCIGIKNPANKFCQQCLASFCELHLLPHYESPAFMKHKLVQASVQLQKNICPHHGKLLDVYCNDDQQCICYLCMMDNHKEHRTSSVESEMIRNQDALERTKIQCQQMIDQREEGLQELNKAVTSFECFAQAAEGDSERIFAELISSMKRKCSEVKELIRAHKKRELNEAEEHRIQLSHNLAELRTKMTEIQQLLDTKDPIDFMREYHCTRAMPTFNDLPSLTCQHHESSENISLCELKECVEEICQQEVGRISRGVLNIRLVQPTEPKDREEFLYLSDSAESQPLDVAQPASQPVPMVSMSTAATGNQGETFHTIFDKVYKWTSGAKPSDNMSLPFASQQSGFSFGTDTHSNQQPRLFGLPSKNLPARGLPTTPSIPPVRRGSPFNRATRGGGFKRGFF